MPLPGPVLTISRPFSTVLPATSASCTALRLAILACGARLRSSSIVGHPFHLQRQAGDHEEHRCRRRAATRWLSRPGGVAEAAGERIVGHDAEADLVGDDEPGAARRGQHGGEPADSASRSCSASMRLVSQSVRQSTSTGRPSGTAASAPARSSGASTVFQPAPRRARWSGDALRHLVVEGLGRGDVGPGRGQRGDQRLGVRALAGARAAEEEGQAARRQASCGCGAPAGRRSAAAPAPTTPPSTTQKTRLVTVTATTKLVVQVCRDRRFVARRAAARR